MSVDVVTSVWCRDLVWPRGCRDVVLMSRHGPSIVGNFGIATSFLRSLAGFWCRDLEIPQWAEMRS